MRKDPGVRVKALLWLVVMALSLLVAIAIAFVQGTAYNDRFCSGSDVLSELGNRVAAGERRLISQKSRFWPPGVTCRFELLEGERWVEREISRHGSRIPSLLPFLGGVLLVWVVRLRRQALAPFP